VTVTVAALPDDILLEIFDFYLERSYPEDAWQTLVHVCKRWRCIVFASPHRLQLQLLCTNKRPVQNTLDIWPALPIVIRGLPGMSKPQDTRNILAAFKRHSRVCKIYIDGIPNTLWKRIRAVEMRDPFSALTSLQLSSKNSNAPALSDSFLGGSAPRLQTLALTGVPFPTLANLLLSTHDLVELDLRDIPHSGYISPEAMVTGFSALTRLQTLCLKFRSPRSQADRQNPLPPYLTRIVLPALATFHFKGDSEYLEDIMARIDTPFLDGFYITFFNQLIFDTPRLRDFIARTKMLKAPRQADIWFFDGEVKVSLFRQDGTGMDGHHALSSEVLCIPLDWQLSSLVQVCNSAGSPLSVLERLEIKNNRGKWQSDIENAQWLDVLRPFTSVKDLVLYWKPIQFVAPALEELSRERVTDLIEVLPALENLFLQGPEPSGLVKKAIGKFIAARQLSGFPVTVHHRDLWYQDYVCWEIGDS
jgi:hypothetical protein